MAGLSDGLLAMVHRTEAVKGIIRLSIVIQLSVLKKSLPKVRTSQ